MSDSTETGLLDDQVVTGATVEIARRYALALIDAAFPERAVDSLLEELGEIQRDVLKAFPRFAEVFASARVSPSKKDRMLLDVFEKRASSLVLRFLRVLNRHERLGLFDVVVREARSIWDRRNQRVPVQVRSAVPLDETQLTILRERLARLTGATPILQVSIDPDLIGGLVVQVGDQRYDLSVKTSLAQLRQRLIEGKTHEIQSRRDQFSHPA
ncbi:MAG: ATP synthase F1 subunit delta [Isosphaerales bacterium]